MRKLVMKEVEIVLCDDCGMEIHGNWYGIKDTDFCDKCWKDAKKGVEK